MIINEPSLQEYIYQLLSDLFLLLLFIINLLADLCKDYLI